MAKSRKLFFFFPFSLRGAAGGRERRASNRVQGRARPLYRLTLAGPPFPLPLSFSSLPSHLSPSSSCYLSPTSLPQPPPPLSPSTQAQISACPPRKSPPTRAPALGAPRERPPAPLRRFASPFSAAFSPAGGGRRTAAPPTPSLRVLKGWAPLPCQNRRRLRWEP